MPLEDTVPGQLDAINRRLDDGDREFRKLRAEVAENTALTRENTRVTQETADDIKAVREALVFARVGSRLIKWMGGLGAVVITGWQLWQIWRKP
jgi:hypothetical protein